VTEKHPGGVRFLIDKLCHASLIDAIGASARPFRVFPHNQYAKLERLLTGASTDQLQVVVTESIFSMDGDRVDLAALANLKRQRPFTLVLDEAHAAGVYGPAGAGLAAELGMRDLVDISIVTLSKALGSGGGAICSSRLFCECVVNFGRAYIYSTSVPPTTAAAVSCALAILRDEPQRQARVRELAKRTRSALAAAGLKLPAGDSPILPIILGDERAVVEATERLLKCGIFAAAIRAPTVARGASRLRITLSSEHTDAEIALLIESLGAMEARMR
jgi:8-amino-7-oxononanoate synthase